MDASGLSLLPAGVGPWLAAGLIAVSFVTSATTAVFGLGGGVMMLAVLASVLPPAVILPAHGIVQIGSNVGRTVVMRRYIAWPLLLPFVLGSIIGVMLAAPLVTSAPPAILRAILGLFILYSTWTPRLRPADIPRWGFVPVGAASSFGSMFLGATGPLVAAFINPNRLARHGVIATHAACMTVQHGFKVLAFTLVGFVILPWLPLLAAMIGAGFLGTLTGRFTLDRVPEKAFALAFKLLLTLLALQLVWEATALLPG